LMVAVGIERRNVRADVRRRVQHASPVLECFASERQALRQALDTVVPRWNDVRVDVYEAGSHPATVATQP